MGNTVSSEQILDITTQVITESVNENIFNCKGTASIVQRANIDEIIIGKGCENFNAVNQQANLEINLSCLNESNQEALNITDIKQKLQSELEQTSGLNLGMLDSNVSSSITKYVNSVVTKTNLTNVTNCISSYFVNMDANIGRVVCNEKNASVANQVVAIDIIINCLAKNNQVIQAANTLSSELEQSTSMSSGISSTALIFIAIAVALVAILILILYLKKGK